MKIKNKTYHNFLIVKNRIINDKHYSPAEASELAHVVFENFEFDKGYGDRPIDFFIDKIITKEEYEKEYSV